MRFVTINSLKEGMVIAKPILGNNGEILLHSGVVLREPYIIRLKEMGFPGIYIEDTLSKDINVSDLIDPNLRSNCIKAIKDLYTDLINGKLISEKIVKEIGMLLDEVIDNILNNSELIVNIIDLKSYDDYTYSHSVNVCILSLSIGCVMGLSKSILFKLGMAALMHDLGKVFIPKEILNKTGELSRNEYEIIKSHPYKGYQVLKENHLFPYYSCIGVLHHHERYNGTGYPNELTGTDISLLGRIITVADVYDALTSDRPYRKAMFPSEAIEYIMGGGGTLFDPDITRIFTRIVAPYPIGTCVILSNNDIGIVVKNYTDCCMRPLIRIIKHNGEYVTPYEIDLKNDNSARGIVITGIADL